MSYYEDKRIGETVMERTGGFLNPRIYPALYNDHPRVEDYWFLRWPILSELRRKMLGGQLSEERVRE